MDIELLREFTTLYETLNFTRAAQRAHTSQSVLSRHIQSIERELNVRLFDRDRHSVAATPQGKLLYEDAKAIVRRYDAALTRISPKTADQCSHLRVAYLAGACAPFMEQAYRTFLADNPHVQVSLRTIEYADALGMLADDSADLVITLETGENLESSLVTKKIYDDQFCICVHRGHRLFDERLIRLDDLENIPFRILNFDKGNELSRALTEQLAMRGIYDFGTFIVESADSIPIALPPAAEQTCIIMALQLSNLFEVVPDTRFIPIDDAPAIPVSAIWRPGETEPAARAFVTSIEDEIACAP